ncbi:uncharacterized protein LOC143537329 [Bidens hawaiensis]|uniref:uncharacterized protein LOC143537329 n=1 Tax=Bidens hawaiensis TaxID=980011 RepID=UPI004048F3EC
MDAFPTLYSHFFYDVSEHTCILQVLKKPINKGCFLASCDKKFYEDVQQALITPIITVDGQGSIQVLPLTDLQLKKIFGEEESVDNENDLSFGLAQDDVAELEQEEGVNTKEENALVEE